MAVKSIVDIEIKDDSFKEFLVLFNEYKDALNAMPEAWDKVDEASASTNGTAEELVANANNQVEATRRFLEAWGAVDAKTRATHTSVDAIVKALATQNTSTKALADGWKNTGTGTKAASVSIGDMQTATVRQAELTRSLSEAWKSVDDNTRQSVSTLADSLDDLNASADLANASAAKWTNISAKTGESKEGYGDITAAIAAQLEMLRRLIVEQDASNNSTVRTASVWDKVEHRTKSTAKSIADMTASLLKWGTISSIATGILGGGGLYGIDRAADRVGAQRRSAQGLGITTGEQQAFEVFGSRVVEARSFLSALSESKASYNHQGLYALGLNEQQIQSSDAFSLGVSGLEGLKSRLDNLPKDAGGKPKGIPELLASTGVQGVDVQSAQRLAGLSIEEFAQVISEIKQGAKTFALPDSTTKAYQDLSVHMEASWNKIEQSFVVGLVNLANPLEHLGDAASDLILALSSDPDLGHWVTEFGDAIESASKYIGDPEFKKAVQDFFEGLERLTESVEHTVKYLLGIGEPSTLPEKDASLEKDAYITEKINTGKSLTPNEKSYFKGRIDNWEKLPSTDPLSLSHERAEKARAGLGIDPPQTDPRLATSHLDGQPWYNPTVPVPRVSSGIFGLGDKLRGIPDVPAPFKPGSDISFDLMDYYVKQGHSVDEAAGIVANYKRESNLDPHAIGDNGSAYGIEQDHPDRQQKFAELFGHDIRKSTIEEQAAFGEWELRNTEKNTGSQIKGKSAYDAGKIFAEFDERPKDPTGVKADERGNDAKKLAADYTQSPTYRAPEQGQQSDYSRILNDIASAIRSQGRSTGQGVKITIDNQAGGNPVITSQQLIQ